MRIIICRYLVGRRGLVRRSYGSTSRVRRSHSRFRGQSQPKPASHPPRLLSLPYCCCCPTRSTKPSPTAWLPTSHKPPAPESVERIPFAVHVPYGTYLRTLDATRRCASLGPSSFLWPDKVGCTQPIKRCAPRCHCTCTFLVEFLLNKRCA